MATRLLVIGRSGLLATELQRLSLPSGFTLEALGRDAFDLTDFTAIDAHLRRARPDAVINAAGYTAVDRAEQEPEAALALNSHGPAVLAHACAEIDVPLIHVSSDYVFNGENPKPYVETDLKAPINVYGRSKAEGEDGVLSSGARATILRTSWVYASHGANFLKTMLRLAATQDDVNVVSDQIGRPTWAKDLARACLDVAIRGLDRDQTARGIFHYCGAGDASWADFADAIFAETARRGGRAARVTRIASSGYPTPAKRPSNSRLDTTKIEQSFGLKPSAWRESCARCIAELLA